MTQNNVQGGPAVPGCQSVALLSANIQRETTPVHLPSFVPSFGHECFTTLVVSCIYICIYIYTNKYTMQIYMLYNFFHTGWQVQTGLGKHQCAHVLLIVASQSLVAWECPGTFLSQMAQISMTASYGGISMSNVQALNMYIGLHSTQSSGTLLKWSETICTLFHYVPLVWVKIL